LIAEGAAGLLGVLPLCEVRGPLFGRALTSLPFVNYGGVLTHDDETALTLVGAAEEIARTRGLQFVLLRHREQVFKLPARRHKVAMVRPLPAEADDLWNALDRKVRNHVRKALKSDLTTLIGGAELLNDFYSVFAENMRDLGTPVYSRRLFAAILTAFPRDARVHVVRLGGRTVAAALSYAFGDTLEIPSSSSLREFRVLCANYLMYWNVLVHAIESGHTRFDFGRSTPDDGTFQFKKQWGAVAEPLCWEYVLTGLEAIPEDDRSSRKFRASIELWKRLPLPVANFLGPWISRAVP